MDKAQVIIVGSGMNSLACAALLAKRGKSVLVLERNNRPGGCIRTEELFPGFTHDVFSQWYPLFLGGGVYPQLKDDLAAEGVEFVSNGYATGVVIPDGRTLALKQDVGDAVQRISALCGEADGAAFGAMVSQLFEKDAALTFGLLSQSPYGRGFLKLLFSEWRKRGVDGLFAYAKDAIETCRRWSEREFKSDLLRAAIAPWTLHTGLGPDDASSALIGKLTFAAVVAGGMPVVKGGSQRIVDAMVSIIQKHGGQVLTDVDVESITLDGKRATGVNAGGRQYAASQAVVCNVTPPQLYGRLLPGAPAAMQEQAAAYRFGRGCMQIHFALDGAVPWTDPEMQKVPLVHLTESLENTCMSVVEANNGLLPRRPTIGIGQPAAVDPSRAPEGKSILWLQLQEMPSRIKGDAANEIAAPSDGLWTDAIREAVADRVQARLETVLPGFSSQIIGRKAYSPADLERFNCNLVGGDPYSGICSPDQFFWFRPFASGNGARGHHTPYKNVFHIGASTHPGPGLGGGSGQLVAQLLSR